jgi:hypothetical protein
MKIFRTASIAALMVLAVNFVNAQALSGTFSSQTNVSCFGMCDGSLTVTPSGGTGGPYTYLWSQGAVTQTITNLCAGTYTCTIDDGVSTFFLSTTITQPAAVNINLSNVINATCSGVCNGAANTAASGGSLPYTYTWTGPNGYTSTLSNVTSLCAGNYTVTVTEAGGCSVNQGFAITEPSPVTVSIPSSLNATCFGACDGTVTATASGGTSPYTYSWLPNGVTTQAVTGLCAGIYTVTVTDVNACQATTTVSILQPSAVTASVTATTNESCNNSCDGGASVTASGGTPGYTFLWLPGANTTPNITNYCAGNYTCTVTDNNGCATTAIATITAPPAITVSISGPLSICNGASANMCASGSNGVGAYTYSWGGPPCLLNQTSACAIFSCATSMTFTAFVTDANGCSGSNAVTINVQPLPVPSVVSYAEASCAGTNGTISFTATSGTPAYLFDLSPLPGQNTTGIFNGLPTGTYNLTVTDANGCTGSLFHTLLDSCEVVWPGDADNDLTANNFDILDIGLYYGNTGPVRPVTGNNWAGYPAQNFTNTKPNGFNEKHDDCNGDGTIDASDTTAVIANYNYVHPPYKLAMSAANGTPLTLEFVQDTVSNYSTAQMRIKLGSGSSPANNIYGLALTLSIDTTIIAQDSTQIDVNSSWLAAGSPVFLNNVIENYANGEIDIALSRTDHLNVSGNGEVASISMTMKDDISGKIMTGVTKTLEVNITKVKLISANGDTVEYAASGDSLVVDQLSTTSLPLKIVSQVKLYPNPAYDFTLVTSTTNNLLKAEIYSLQGKKVEELKNEQAAKEIMISTKSMEKGIYIMKVFTTEGIKIFRLQVINH